MDKIKCVVFDMDMTLIDTDLLHLKSFEKVLEREGYKTPNFKFVQGWSNEELLRFNIKGIKEKEIKRLINLKQKVFIEEYLTKSKKVPYAKYVLNTLKKRGIKVCLFTQESPLENKALMDFIGFKDFDVVVNSKKVKKLKPNPEGLKLIKDKLKIKKNEMIFVGDSSHDLEATKRFGINFILMSKFYKIKEWREASYIIKDLREVLSIV